HSTTNLFVAEKLRRIGGPRLACTWLEPLGIGGHVFVETSAHDGMRGCLRCLYTHEEKDVLHNRADCAAHDQAFVREAGGCGGSFTPFTSLDATKTAELAARVVIDVLQAKRPGAVLRSWKGDAMVFREAGYA